MTCGSDRFTVPAGSCGAMEPGHYLATSSQDTLISEMIMSHAVSDICVIGPPVSNIHISNIDTGVISLFKYRDAVRQ